MRNKSLTAQPTLSPIGSNNSRSHFPKRVSRDREEQDADVSCCPMLSHALLALKKVTKPPERTGGRGLSRLSAAFCCRESRCTQRVQKNEYLGSEDTQSYQTERNGLPARGRRDISNLPTELRFGGLRVNN